MEPDEPLIRNEYDFAGGERGKYAQRYADGSNVVVLDPDVAKSFPDSKAVNDALRQLATVAARIPSAEKAG